MPDGIVYRTINIAFAVPVVPRKRHFQRHFFRPQKPTPQLSSQLVLLVSWVSTFPLLVSFIVGCFDSSHRTISAKVNRWAICDDGCAYHSSSSSLLSWQLPSCVIVLFFLYFGCICILALCPPAVVATYNPHPLPYMHPLHILTNPPPCISLHRLFLSCSIKEKTRPVKTRDKAGKDKTRQDQYNNINQSHSTLLDWN